MSRPRSVNKAEHSAKRAAPRAWTRLGVVCSAIAAACVVTVSLAGVTPVFATASPQAGQAREKHYKATRPFVVDKQTGDVRMPTQQEVDDVVANLTTMGQRPAESLPQSSQANGAVGLDLDGGFAGVLLARPNADGTWETRCVFTLEEGAAFLGIVEDDSIR
jgi:hypothetical protein